MQAFLHNNYLNTNQPVLVEFSSMTSNLVMPAETESVSALSLTSVAFTVCSVPTSRSTNSKTVESHDCGSPGWAVQTASNTSTRHTLIYITLLLKDINVSKQCTYLRNTVDLRNNSEKRTALKFIYLVYYVGTIFPLSSGGRPMLVQRLFFYGRHAKICLEPICFK